MYSGLVAKSYHNLVNDTSCFDSNHQPLVGSPGTCATKFSSANSDYNNIRYVGNGLFFTGVRTTRIYCRPICPARPARSENVTFFPSAAAFFSFVRKITFPLCT